MYNNEDLANKLACRPLKEQIAMIVTEFALGSAVDVAVSVPLVGLYNQYAKAAGTKRATYLLGAIGCGCISGMVSTTVATFTTDAIFAVIDSARAIKDAIQKAKEESAAAEVNEDEGD